MNNSGHILEFFPLLLQYIAYSNIHPHIATVPLFDAFNSFSKFIPNNTLVSCFPCKYTGKTNPADKERECLQCGSCQ